MREHPRARETFQPLTTCHDRQHLTLYDHHHDILLETLAFRFHAFREEPPGVPSGDVRKLINESDVLIHIAEKGFKLGIRNFKESDPVGLCWTWEPQIQTNDMIS